MDWLHYVAEVMVELHDLIRLPNFLAEAGVLTALLLPDGLLGPSIDHLEPLHEEDSEVLSLVVGAAVDRWDDAFHYLSEDVEDVDLGHLELHQKLKELDRVHGVSWREHQPWIQAVLDEELADALLLGDVREVLG